MPYFMAKSREANAIQILLFCDDKKLKSHTIIVNHYSAHRYK